MAAGPKLREQLKMNKYDQCPGPVDPGDGKIRGQFGDMVIIDDPLPRYPEGDTNGVSDGGSTDYYALPEGAVELQDLIEYRDMNFAVANIFKAAYRLGNKAGINRKYDLNKIIWFAQDALDRIHAKDPNNPRADDESERSGND